MSNSEYAIDLYQKIWITWSLKETSTNTLDTSANESNQYKNQTKSDYED